MFIINRQVCFPFQTEIRTQKKTIESADENAARLLDQQTGIVDVDTIVVEEMLSDMHNELRNIQHLANAPSIELESSPEEPTSCSEEEIMSQLKEIKSRLDAVRLIVDSSQYSSEDTVDTAKEKLAQILVSLCENVIILHILLYSVVRRIFVGFQFL